MSSAVHTGHHEAAVLVLVIDDTKNQPEQRVVSQPGDKGLADKLCSPHVLGPIPALALLKHLTCFTLKKKTKTKYSYY